MTIPLQAANHTFALRARILVEFMTVAKIPSAKNPQNVKARVWNIVLVKFGRTETFPGTEVVCDACSRIN